MTTAVLVVGPAAAGKTLLLQQLEPLGWTSIDGVPVSVLPTLLPVLPSTPTVIGVRLTYPRDPEILLEWWVSLSPRPVLIFLTARPEVLQRRLQGSRRSHPYLENQGSLSAAIRSEWEQVYSLAEHCDQVWDTSEFLPQDLVGRWQQWQQHRPQPLHLTLVSFGYKYGIPSDAHLVFDVRFLPNPYYVPELRPLTGTDPHLQDYIWTFPQSHHAYDQVHQLIKEWLPRYEEERRPQLTIAVGCTGGQHRSVTLIERLGHDLSHSGYRLSLEHRHLRQSQAEIAKLGATRGNHA
ncbi:MAG: RNase adapter RapZ [Synechococcales cyanobacterium]